MGNSKESIERFNEVARQWDDKPQRVELAEAISAGIIENILLNKNIEALEFGCGTGLVGLPIAQHIKHLTAIDNSDEMIAVLTEKLTSARIKNIKPVCLDFITAQSDKHYDLIFSAMVLHHVQDIDALLEKFHQSLGPGGWFAIADLDSEDGTFHPDPKGVAHHGIDRNKLSDKLTTLGFEVKKKITVHTIEKEIQSGKIAQYPVFLLTAQKS